MGVTSMEINNIYNMDCMEGLAKIEDNTIDCCITSPPYWGLRDYGVDGQIGLEETPEEYVAKMVEIFREVRRVLKPEGTLWLNLGDSYWANRSQNGLSYENTTGKSLPYMLRSGGAGHAQLKPKDLCGMPWRVALALQADGWWLRQDIIWNKPNPMPESVTDRCTKAHEYIFLLTKSAHYYYDREAIKESCVGFNNEPIAGSKGAFGGPQSRRRYKVPSGWDTEEGSHGTIHRQGRSKGNAKTFRGGGTYTKQQSYNNHADTERESHGNEPNESGLRNKRSVWTMTKIQYIEWLWQNENKEDVWTVSTQGYADAHFATFPEKLIEPCVLAGCPKGGVVCDPFMGSGTTAEVAIKHYRNYLGFELNPEYIKLANKRIKNVQLKFA